VDYSLALVVVFHRFEGLHDFLDRRFRFGVLRLQAGLNGPGQLLLLADDFGQFRDHGFAALRLVGHLLLQAPDLFPECLAGRFVMVMVGMSGHGG